MSTTNNRAGRALAAALAVSALVAGCGLKSDPSPASAQGAPPVGESGAPSGDASSPQTGSVSAVPPDAPVAASASSAPSTDAPTTARQPSPRTVATGSPSSAPGGTVGIDSANKTLRVALHGPSAGVAGARKYWDASGPDGGPRRVLGYRIVVEHLDDQHGSGGASPDCERAARTAFALVSVAGAEQTRSCARSRLLQRDGVPYIALGGADTGLGGPNHFASSLTYRQQAPLIVRMARDNGFLNNKWAVVVVGNDPSLADARASIVEALTGADVTGRSGAFDEARDVYAMERSARDCVSVGNQLRQGDYGSVYFVGASPLLYAQCVNQHPSAIYSGVGPTPETAAVEPTCRGGSAQYRGFYLNPTPDPQMARSLAKGAPALADDEIPGWAAMQMLEQALTLVRGPLGRASFTRALASGGTAGGVLNPTAYRGRTHFGGTAAYANRIDCSGGRAAVTTVATYRR